jgi:hypothetical protein
MLLTTANEVPTDDDWALEVKWDGMRAQLRFDVRRVTVRSRVGRDCTAQFPELRALADTLTGTYVVAMPARLWMLSCATKSEVETAPSTSSGRSPR